MKKILLFLTVSCFCVSVIAQVAKQPVTLPDSIKLGPATNPNRLTTACPGWASHGYCNLMFVNNQFNVVGKPDYLDPFSTTNVPGWAPSHGTPQVNVFGPPAFSLHLPGGTNYASMWGSNGLGEGIIGNIPDASPFALNAGQPFLLSFYRRVPPQGSTTQLDRITIVLLNCSDLPAFPGSASNSIPAIPSTAQVIYCETNIPVSLTANRVVVQFTPNAKYDLIWIYPSQTTTPGQAWLDIAFPQIFEAALYDGPRYYDPSMNAHFLGDAGVAALPYMASQLCHEVNTVAEWLNSSGTPVWSLNVLGNSYNNSCPYTTTCPTLYGPIYPNPLNPALFTFRETFINAITTSNTCSTPVLSRTTGVLTFRQSTNTYESEPSAGTKDNVQTNYDKHASKITVRAVSSSEKSLAVTVFDQQGRMVSKTYNAKVQKGVSDHFISTPGLSTGIYIVKMTMGSESYSYKFLVD